MGDEYFEVEQAKYELGMIIRMLDERLGRAETTEILRTYANMPF